LSRFKQFRQAIEENGWQVEEVDIEDVPTDYLIVWKVTSVYSPIGASGYVLFEIDAALEDLNNPVENDVWALLVAKKIQTSRHILRQIVLKRRFKEAAFELLEDLKRLRDGHLN